MSGKRSYTVPVLLLIIVVLTTMIVMVYSKLLIAQQKQNTDEGKRLAEQYTLAIAFAEHLSEGSGRLLKDDSMTDRLQGNRLLGEAAYPAQDAVAIMADASHRSTGQSLDVAFEPLSAAMADLSGKLSGIAEHEGSLTATEKNILMRVHSGVSRMSDALHKFRPPTGEAGFRQMRAGGDWVSAANDAAKALKDTAAQLTAIK